MHYSVQRTDLIFVKGQGFFSFTIDIGKIVTKNLSGKQSKSLLDHAKQSATVTFKTASKRAIQKALEATGYLNGIKIPNKITKISKNSQQNNSETVTVGNDKEIKIYIFIL